MRTVTLAAVLAFASVTMPAFAGVTVVGGDKKCSTGLSDRDHRTAVVKKQALKGMTEREIQSILGRPDNTSNANGQVSYRYWDGGNREYARVDFDRNGCATWVYQSKDN